MNKRIVMWCNDASNQKALAQKLHQRFGLTAIVIDRKLNQSKNAPQKKSLWTKLYKAWYFWPIHFAWRCMLRNYEKQYPDWPKVSILRTDTINSTEAHDFTVAISSDLIIVSGTSLVKEPLLSIPVTIGIMNLHTGLSPYIKGGPNCTNWCIAENKWHLVGNTIMWINAGIDTGNIITTETVEITECNSLTHAHIKVMDSAHNLYLRAVNYVLSIEPPYISIPQKEIGEGKIYYSKMWNDNTKKSLVRNWRTRKARVQQTSPKTVSLPNP